MTTLAVSDSDLLALSILGVACCALAVLIGGLFWIMLKNGKKAKEQEDLFRGLEGIFDDDPEPETTKGSKSVPKQDWEKDADWWKE